jgi:hypothetical protein
MAVLRKNQIDYPDVWGSKRVAEWAHVGPASYVQVSNATPATGGDPVPFSEISGQGGLKAVDMLEVPMTSDNGQYEAVAIPIDGASQSSWGIQPSKNFILRWFVSSTGAEVAGAVNLSARTIRLRAIGPK